MCNRRKYVDDHEYCVGKQLVGNDKVSFKVIFQYSLHSLKDSLNIYVHKEDRDSNQVPSSC
jgi:hypothetical protein